MILGTRSNRISMAMANLLMERMSERFPDKSMELKIIAGAGATVGRNTTFEKVGLLGGVV